MSGRGGVLFPERFYACCIEGFGWYRLPEVVSWPRV